MGLFSKFKQWHNGGLVSAQVEKPAVCEAVKALAKENYTKLFPKPHIHPVWYPKSKRIYWRVSPMPLKRSECDYALWKEAHNYAMLLNNQIGAKMEAERLAKKEKQK